MTSVIEVINLHKQSLYKYPTQHTVPVSLEPVPVAGTQFPTLCDWHLKPWSHQHLQVFHCTPVDIICRIYYTIHCHIPTNSGLHSSQVVNDSVENYKYFIFTTRQTPANNPQIHFQMVPEKECQIWDLYYNCTLHILNRLLHNA